MKSFLGGLFTVLALIFMAGCTFNGGNSSNESSNGSQSGNSATTNTTEQTTNVFDITMANQDFEYDGTPKSLSISGTLPAGITVTYSSNNSQIHTGTYQITAKFSGTGELPPNITATLKIVNSNCPFDYTRTATGITINGSKNKTLSEITIPEEIEGLPVIAIGARAFENQTDMRKIVLPANLQIIDDSAFYRCENLGVVVLPLTSKLTTIGDSAFARCIWMTRLYLPNTVTTIGASAFKYCYKWPIEALPSATKTIGAFAFSSCYEAFLNDLVIPNGVTSIGYNAFDKTKYYGTAENWENNVLYAGTWLINVKSEISDEYIIKAGTKVIVDKAFENCANITKITIPDSIEKIGNEAFKNCLLLEDIVVPDKAIKIGFNAFLGTGFYNNAANWENNYAYNGLYLNTWLIKVEKRASLASSTYRALYTVLPDTKVIASESFFRVDISGVALPDSLEIIGDYAFYQCNYIQEANIPNAVTSIGDYAFSKCTKLLNVTLGSGIQNIGINPFFECIQITNMSMPTSNSKYKSVDNCLIDIPNKTLVVGTKYSTIPQDGSVQIIGELSFSGCRLRSIIIPQSITIIEMGAFKGCDELERVTMPDGLVTINSFAFEKCTSLEEIVIPQSVLYVGEQIFNDCINILINCVIDNQAIGWNENWNLDRFSVIWNYQK